MLGFSHITWPVSQVTKGGSKTKFVWLKSQHKTFKDMKYHLSLALVLTLPNLQQPFEIKTNALDYVSSVALTQHGHPMTYHSKTLSDAIFKYPTYDKDIWSIVQYCHQC